MEKLLKLTEQLVELSSVSEDSANGLREYQLESGMAFSSTVYQSPNVSMAIGVFSKDTIFPLHNHPNSLEILICFKGSMTLVTDEERLVVNPGDTVKIDRGVNHMFHVHADLKMVIITIPPDFEAMAKIKNSDGGTE
ncbi:MAG: cupin domain-containing protein [Planctomycetota bacterium]|jgi:quercetin dioxygenase-like cupin family protein